MGYEDRPGIFKTFYDARVLSLWLSEQERLAERGVSVGERIRRDILRKLGRRRA